MDRKSMLHIIPTFKLFIMEMGKILSADVLDIIFDQRNKEYGAYDLRKHYQRRLTKSLSITFLVVVLLCLTYILLGSMKPDDGKLLATKEIILEKAPDKDKQVDKLPPPPQKVIVPEVKTIKDMTVRIVKDNVHIDDPVPEQKDIEEAKISNITAAGIDETGIVTAPVDQRTGVVDQPKKNNDDDATWFGPVEIESQYPGGLPAWSAFLYRKLVYPQQAIDDGKQGTVIVRFIVDKEGSVSDVEAISGPEELRAAAVNVVKKSGRWEPAIQNGRKVKSYKSQPITFKLSDD